MDTISLDRINLLHPAIRNEVLQIANAIKFDTDNTSFRITQGLRTFEEQNKLYQQGRTVAGAKVTNAQGGKSMHNYGLAFDIVIIRDGKLSWDIDQDWMAVVKAYKEKNYSWGGDWKKFKDYPHFEKTFNFSVSDLLSKYKKKDFLQGTNYVKL